MEEKKFIQFKKEEFKTKEYIKKFLGKGTRAGSSGGGRRRRLESADRSRFNPHLAQENRGGRRIGRPHRRLQGAHHRAGHRHAPGRRTNLWRSAVLRLLPSAPV